MDCCNHNHKGEHELVVQNLNVSYAAGNQIVTALQDINFTITCGHRLALLGPNGAGKSTLIKSLVGLLPLHKRGHKKSGQKLSQGDILWRGESLLKSTNEIAYLPQLDKHYAQVPLTVKEVVAMGRYPYVGTTKHYTKHDIDEIESAIELMKLQDLTGRQINQLSGGQIQRAFIARAIAQKAHVLILDEPLNGLDVESRRQLIELMHDLSDRGHLIVSSHHDLSTVHETFDKALVLNGEQVAFGDVGEVMQQQKVKDTLGIL